MMTQPKSRNWFCFLNKKKLISGALCAVPASNSVNPQKLVPWSCHTGAFGPCLMHIWKVPQDMWHRHNHMKKECWVVDSHAWWATTTSIFLLLVHNNTTISTIYHYFVFMLIIKFFYEINVTKRNVCCYYSCFTTCIGCLPRKHLKKVNVQWSWNI